MIIYHDYNDDNDDDDDDDDGHDKGDGDYNCRVIIKHLYFFQDAAQRSTSTRNVALIVTACVVVSLCTSVHLSNVCLYSVLCTNACLYTVYTRLMYDCPVY